MKMRKIFFMTVVAAITLSVLSCAKAEKEPEPEDPVPSEPAPVFNWDPAGGSHTVADSGYFIKAYNEIVAYKNGNSNLVDIRLSDSKSATYTISSSTGNQLEYVVGSKTYTGTFGTVTLVNNNTKISGSFSCALSGGSITSVSGQFSDIPAR
jgi:hypothetical protein